MNWQSIIVGIIVLFCLFEIIRRTLKFFRSAKANDNPCASCASGCDLKRMFDEKQQDCRSKQKKGSNKKKCCG